MLRVWVTGRDCAKRKAAMRGLRRCGGTGRRGGWGKRIRIPPREMSAYDLDFESYRATVPYPERLHKPFAQATAEKHIEYGKWLQAGGMEKYQQDMIAYRASEADAMARFRADVLVAADIAGHPRADALYALAWQEGHSSGLREVAMWVDRLADLIRGL